MSVPVFGSAEQNPWLGQVYQALASRQFISTYPELIAQELNISWLLVKDALDTLVDRGLAKRSLNGRYKALASVAERTNP